MVKNTSGGTKNVDLDLGTPPTKRQSSSICSTHVSTETTNARSHRNHVKVKGRTQKKTAKTTSLNGLSSHN